MEIKTLFARAAVSLALLVPCSGLAQDEEGDIAPEAFIAEDIEAGNDTESDMGYRDRSSVGDTGSAGRGFGNSGQSAGQGDGKAEGNFGTASGMAERAIEVRDDPNFGPNY